MQRETCPCTCNEDPITALNPISLAVSGLPQLDCNGDSKSLRVRHSLSAYFIPSFMLQLMHIARSLAAAVRLTSQGASHRNVTCLRPGQPVSDGAGRAAKSRCRITRELLPVKRADSAAQVPSSGRLTLPNEGPCHVLPMPIGARRAVGKVKSRGSVLSIIQEIKMLAALTSV